MITEAEIKVYDDFIATHKLVEKTMLPVDTLRNIIRKTLIANTFAYVFADIVDYFIKDCDEYLGKFDKCFSRESKQYYNEMRKHIIAAKKYSKKLWEPASDNACTDDICSDSDWWFSFIKLVDDRIEGNSENANKLLECLFNMPEGDSPYKVEYDDFKTFKY